MHVAQNRAVTPNIGHQHFLSPRFQPRCNYIFIRFDLTKVNSLASFKYLNRPRERSDQTGFRRRIRST